MVVSLGPWRPTTLCYLCLRDGGTGSKVAGGGSPLISVMDLVSPPSDRWLQVYGAWYPSPRTHLGKSPAYLPHPGHLELGKSHGVGAGWSSISSAGVSLPRADLHNKVSRGNQISLQESEGQAVACCGQLSLAQPPRGPGSTSHQPLKILQ